MSTNTNNRRQFLKKSILTLGGAWAGLSFGLSCRSKTQRQPGPNILFIVIDDMNDWISTLNKNAPIQTPNLTRLATRGVLFTNAHCASPACNPSRAAALTGLRPATSGVYGNRSDWRRAMPDRKTIMQRFMDAGYTVKGAGKIFHHHFDGAFHDASSFHEFQHMAPQLYPPEKLNGAPEYGTRNTDWGKWPNDEKDTIDHKTVDYCIESLKTATKDRPLFLACGIYKPHSPFFAPAEYHDPYADIELPTRNPNDWDDLPSGATELLRPVKWFWEGMQALQTRRPGSYQAFIRSYAACASFADAQIGRLLDALDASPLNDNTIIVLWSDNGFHLGEKDHIEKFALWEKTSRVPFIVVAPGKTQPDSRCRTPVDIMSLYPTLLELAGLPADPECDGTSIVPLLENPDAEWTRPALMTYGRRNHAVRTTQWRYILYADGTEELYDASQDPHEWKNLANDNSYRDVCERLRKWLPQRDAPPAPDMTRPPTQG